MNKLYDLLLPENDLKSTKLYENIKLKCSCCERIFLKHKRDFLKCIRLKRTYITCSRKCQSIMATTSIDIACVNCGKSSKKRKYQINTLHNNFCSQSCAATYNNTHKTHGYRRSKLEKWLEEQLNLSYPNLEIHYNRKDTINSELDFYIPSLKLAFELNGVFHYEPIYGPEQLSKIQNNDNRKFQACLERGIELCIIDSSKLKYFKESNCIPYLNMITNIINMQLALGPNRTDVN